MTGTITYPPPNHDQIVPGVVPWAKAGIIIKDGISQGSSYAALMLSGSHGVRMQYDYRHDTAGSDGGVSTKSPRWLRLTRSGDTITGYESADGERWAKVGTAQLPRLPKTVQVGLFATSPGDLTLRPVGLGGATHRRGDLPHRTPPSPRAMPREPTVSAGFYQGTSIRAQSPIRVGGLTCVLSHCV